jgi:hypothetical protein
MSTSTHHALPELEQEDEMFLGGLASSLLGSLGGQGEGEFEDESEDEFEFEFEDELEGEFEFEDEDEGEALANPIKRAYPDAMLEHLGHAAAEAESEAEAEAFIGALVPLAANLVRGAAPVVSRAAPHLLRGLAGVTRRLRRNPATRPLIRAVPAIVRRTTAQLARQVAQGRPITGQSALRTLAGQTASVLGNPRRRAQVIRHAQVADRSYHRYPGSVTVQGTAPASWTTVSRRGYQAGPRRRPRRGSQQLGVAWVPVPAWTSGRPPYGW